MAGTVTAAVDSPSFAALQVFSAGQFPSAFTVGDFNKDGASDLAVADIYGDVSVLLGNGHGSFQTAGFYTNGGYGSFSQITTVDVNQDGNPDLVGTGYIMLGNGDGTFQQPTNSVTGTFGNFNGDSKTDVAFISLGIVVQTNNGDGTYQTSASFGYDSFKINGRIASPQFVALGDMNHDGINDLVVADAGYPGGVSVLLGNGDGTFQTPINTGLRTDTSETDDYYLALGDFNRDGTNDVAITDSKAGTVVVLLGNGDGTFRDQTSYYVSDQAKQVSVADFNSDGTNDLFVTGSTNAAVLLGNGDGTFQMPINYSHIAGGMAVGDFNGDGNADVTAALYGSATSIGIMLGNGDATFQSAPDYAVGFGPLFIATGDLNGDTKPELVVANGNDSNISLLMNKGNGAFQLKTNYVTAYAPQSVVINDFSGTGTNDVAVACEFGSSLSFFRGNGDGTLQPATAIGSFPVGCFSVVAGDFNNNHNTDLAVQGAYLITAGLYSGISVFPGNGNNTFQSSVATPGPSTVDQLVAGNFNDDNNLDVVYGDKGTNTISVMLGKGDGSFQSPVAYGAGTNVQAVAVGDFNGDGTNDLAVASFGTNQDGTISILLGNGDGSFRSFTNYLTGTFVSVAVGDFNADGREDLAAVGSFANQVNVMMGNGDGTFGPAYAFAVGNNPSFVTAADLNGDGLDDLAVANSAGNSVSVLLNTFIQVGPMLKMLPINPADKNITFIWPVSAAAYHLQSIANLGSGSWQTPSLTRTTNGDNVEVTVHIGAGSEFFRLHM